MLLPAESSSLPHHHISFAQMTILCPHFLFISLLYVYVSAYMPQPTCTARRTTCRSVFSTSNMWVLRMALRCQVWQQTPSPVCWKGVPQYVWRSWDNLQEPFLSLPNVGQVGLVTRLGSTCLYLLSHLAVPLNSLYLRVLALYLMLGLSLPYVPKQSIWFCDLKYFLEFVLLVLASRFMYVMALVR